MAGGCRLRVGMDLGAVATGFEQREPQRILAGQKGTTGEATEVANDPIALPIAFDVEVIGWIDTQRSKIRHSDLLSGFTISNRRSRSD